jgi:hypothetical protein
VMMIEDDETPDDKAQLKVNTNLDCWGRVSGGRTTLITILFLEIEFSEPDNHIRFFEISDNERSASEIPASSTLHNIDDSQPHAMMTATVARCITNPDCNEDEWEVCSGVRRVCGEVEELPQQLFQCGGVHLCFETRLAGEIEWVWSVGCGL